MQYIYKQVITFFKFFFSQNTACHCSLPSVNSFTTFVRSSAFGDSYEHIQAKGAYLEGHLQFKNKDNS